MKLANTDQLIVPETSGLVSPAYVREIVHSVEKTWLAFHISPWVRSNFTSFGFSVYKAGLQCFLPILQFSWSILIPSTAAHLLGTRSCRFSFRWTGVPYFTWWRKGCFMLLTWGFWKLEIYRRKFERIWHLWVKKALRTHASSLFHFQKSRNLPVAVSGNTKLAKKTSPK